MTGVLLTHSDMKPSELQARKSYVDIKEKLSQVMIENSQIKINR